jgi:hypothetical protein
LTRHPSKIPQRYLASLTITYDVLILYRITSPIHTTTTMPPTISHSLLKRADDNGFELPTPVIVLLIMIAAGFVVCMGFAIHSAFGFGPDNNKPKPMTVEQMEYMAEVKIRNLEALEREGRHARGGKRRMSGVVYD